ncbi:hypothetical protein U3516DRAFT_744868 [Neocallimastix sp. 'constans']
MLLNKNFNDLIEAYCSDNETKQKVKEYNINISINFSKYCSFCAKVPRKRVIVLKVMGFLNVVINYLSIGYLNIQLFLILD